jgi:nicotinamidase-related amidase
MDALRDLLTPSDCAVIFADQQAGLAFGVQSMDRQTLLNNAIALARTATAFSLPVVASVSASKVYSGPMMPGLHTRPTGRSAFRAAQHERLGRRRGAERD